MMETILSWMIFLPLGGAVAVLFLPKGNERLIRGFGLAVTLAVLAGALLLWRGFNPSAAGFQWEQKIAWIPMIGVHYHVGLDGLNFPLILLTGILGVIALLASHTITERIKEYTFLYLLLLGGMLGTFLALDLFLFYVFWEVVLVPMYFLIGIWGGPRREYAAIKFFLYTLAGSVLMLLSILTCYFASTPHTFSIPALIQQGVTLSGTVQWWVFLGFFVAFAIKVPIFPFHTWLPDAHVEAPTPISVILAGVLLKMGGYAFLRISFPIFPEVARGFGIVFAVLGAINVIYGGFVAMAQTDFKKLVAYSSVAHMGFVLLGFAGLTLTGFNGAMLEMFNHGIITGAMFLVVGMLYERTHTRELSAFGGLGAKVPVYGGMLIFFTLASLGLPGLSGFVSEFLALLGCFPTHPVITGISVLGLVIGAGYFLLLLQRVLLGQMPEKWAGLTDLTVREIWLLVPLIGFTLWIGFWPKVALGWQSPSLAGLLYRIGGNAAW
ncbi:MAG: oxidoreductase [Candidatus Omnitrophica bacterium CG11_big_fil_rev_8_21_14_0_20_64_10]|nr:MAG: oxidoreductase [Candidatus Omnitrophica bacterium CG11_big_fil_rev_8_21_14_0_20_64_10]